MATHDRLDQRIQKLPQELRDMIKDFTFTPSFNTRRIDKHYTPPSLLQVDRASRLQFGQSYYGGDSIFNFEDRKILCRYVKHLDDSHQELIKTFRLLCGWVPGFVSATKRLAVKCEFT